MLREPKFRLDAPVADINNREQLAAWLRKQPREVVRALADRWTLRTLPMAALYRSDLLSDLILPSFRVLALSQAAVNYPSHDMEEAFAAARAAAARAFTAAARAARAVDAILAADAGADAIATFGARAFAAAAADDAEARSFAAAAAARAIAAAATDTAATAFWSAVSADATQWEKGVAATVIDGLPLWPGGQPAGFRSMWQGLKAALHAEKQDWEVWTTWYDDRLEGRVRDKERELAYVRIDDALWEQGPAIVNAEIKRLIETHPAPTQSRPVLPEASIEVATAAGAASAGAARAEIARPRRPVFKGFFSYSHSDAEVDPHIVEAFSSELEKRIDANLVNARFEIWRDNAKLAAGDYWDLSIETAIKSADVFVVLISPKWISSDYCRKEFETFESVELARNSRGYVIPIYGRDIERQTKYLEPGQRELLDRMKHIQHQNVIPREFARLSRDERIDLIEGVAEPICAMLNRLRDKQET